MSETKVINEAAKNKTPAALEEEMARLRADIASLAETLRDLAKEVASDTVDAVKEKLGQASGEVRDVASRAKEKAASAADSAEDTVKEHPLASVLIALGLGFLLAQLLRR